MSWLSTLKRVLSCMLIVLSVLMSSWSNDHEELLQLLKQQAEQMEQMQQRMDAMEQRNAELEARLDQQETKTVEQEQAIESIEHVELEMAKKGVRSSMPIDVYGYLKFDAAYDTARTDTGNFSRWVLPESFNDNDDQFNATANQSRFGLRFNGPAIGSAETSGRVEVDFYGGGPENRSHLMMRHAFARIDWPENDFTLIAGQTADVISPLVPSTVNYPVGWWAGNIGYRRPQLQMRKGFDLTDTTQLEFQSALSRTIGDSNLFGPGDTGEDAGFPTIQGRVGYSFPLLTEKQTVFGISGHWGEEEYDIANTGSNLDFETWSLNADLTLPLLEKLMLKGEYYYGENLDAYLGGIAQGITHIDLDGNPANGNEFPQNVITSHGGWAAMSIGPFGDFMYNLGATIDSPFNDDLNPGSRSQNMSIFGNTFYSVNEALMLGFELSYWETDYLSSDDGDSIRVQASVMYSF